MPPPIVAWPAGVPSLQLIVALNAEAGSEESLSVKVATWPEKAWPSIEVRFTPVGVMMSPPAALALGTATAALAATMPTVATAAIEI
jgi:hypothetical protein